VEGLEQAVQPRPERPGPPAGARARRAAAFALVLETLDVGRNNGMRVVADHFRPRAQSGDWTSGAFLECAGDQHRRPAPFRVDEKRRGVFRRALTRATHRCPHSTNAGGISSRPYLAIPMADPRLIAGIILNMAWNR
jgi:hypothetical protein